MTSDEIGRESSAKVTRSAGGLTPASLCVVPTGLAEILAPYPGLTPWADSMPPRERGFEALVFSHADIASGAEIASLAEIASGAELPQCAEVASYADVPSRL